MTHRPLLVALAVVAGPACKSDSKPDAALRALPGDAFAVVGMSLTEARRPEVAGAYRAALGDRGATTAAAIKKDCALDLARVEGRLTATVSEKRGAALLLETGWSRGEIEGCLRAVARARGAAIEIRDDGAITRYRTGALAGDFAARWVSDRAVMTDHDAARPLSANPEMVALLGRVDRDALVWGVGRISEIDDVVAELYGDKLAVGALLASLKYDRGFRARVTADVSGSDALLEQVRGQAQRYLTRKLSAYVSGAEVKRDGDRLVADMELKPAAIAEMIRRGAARWF